MPRVTRKIRPLILVVGDQPSGNGLELLDGVFAEEGMKWVAVTPGSADLEVEIERPAVVLALGRKAAKMLGISGRLMREVRNVLVWYHGVPCIATWPPDVALANDKKAAEWSEDISTLTVLFNIETGQCAAN